MKLHLHPRRSMGVLVASLLVLSALSLGRPFALKASGASEQTSLTICHATDSTDAPYVMETVHINAGDWLSGDHLNHEGDLFAANPETAWGDIIPPYNDFLGMNWPEGQDILDAGCRVPGYSGNGSTITIHKTMDGVPLMGLQFAVSLTGGPAEVEEDPGLTDGAGYTYATVSFGEAISPVTVTISEIPINPAYELVSLECTLGGDQWGNWDEETGRWSGGVPVGADIACEAVNQFAGATITVYKVYEGSPTIHRRDWNFTVFTEPDFGIEVNGEGNSSERLTKSAGDSANFLLTGGLTERDVVITETPQVGYTLVDVACRYSSSVEDDHPTIVGTSVMVEAGFYGADLTCTFKNRSTGGGSSIGFGGGLEEPRPSAVTTPTPPTQTGGGKLPYTGAPVTAAVTLAALLLAGGVVAVLAGRRLPRRHD